MLEKAGFDKCAKREYTIDQGNETIDGADGRFSGCGR